jgi:thymidylate synthase ThyX
MKPKVTLFNWTPMPMETVWGLWDQSKTEGPIRSPQWVKENIESAEVEKLFRAVIAQRIPIGESIDFIFILEGVSISWREQAVRHRIGTKPSSERLGVDIVHIDAIPDLADSVWWSQSMRIQNMGKFADNQAYRVPDSIYDKRVIFGGERTNAVHLYHSMMLNIQEAYNALVAAGVPMEDARELIPLGAQHRLSWKLNMSSLQHIVGKRGCWILQLGIWGPVIMGMIEELVDKVHPIFRETVTPPCFATGSDDFKGCTYHEECRRRYTGDDELPPCPLHLAQQYDPGGPDHVRLKVVSEDYTIEHPEKGEPIPLPMKSQMLERIEAYTTFWGRDCYTGERIK